MPARRWQQQSVLTPVSGCLDLPRRCSQRWLQNFRGVNSDLIGVPDADGQPGGAKLLRPTHGPEDDDITSRYLQPTTETNTEMHLISTSRNTDMSIRLGVDALEKTKLNLNTNKNEAANRGLSASLPKNVKFSRNCIARSYAAVHRMNYGIGASLLHKLERANCPIASGGHVAKSIHQMQHTQHYHRQYARRRAVRMHRMYSRLRRIKAYRHAKQRQRDIDVYKKGQLDMAPGISDVNKRKNTARAHTVTHTKAQPRRLNTRSHREHPYSLRSTPLDHTYSFDTCN